MLNLSTLVPESYEGLVRWLWDKQAEMKDYRKILKRYIHTNIIYNIYIYILYIYTYISYVIYKRNHTETGSFRIASRRFRNQFIWKNMEKLDSSPSWKKSSCSCLHGPSERWAPGPVSAVRFSDSSPGVSPALCRWNQTISCLGQLRHLMCQRCLKDIEGLNPKTCLQSCCNVSRLLRFRAFTKDSQFRQFGSEKRYWPKSVYRIIYLSHWKCNIL